MINPFRITVNYIVRREKEIIRTAVLSYFVSILIDLASFNLSLLDSPVYKILIITCAWGWFCRYGYRYFIASSMFFLAVSALSLILGIFLVSEGSAVIAYIFLGIGIIQGVAVSIFKKDE